MSITVMLARRLTINITPVRIDIAHSVNIAKVKNGWKNNAMAYYLFPTSW
jgi:hypothetical protein